MDSAKKSGEIRDRFIGEVGRLGESVGLNRTTCQMYALLYLEDGPLSLTELSRILHISKGSASLNIRKLEEWGAVKPVWRKGSTQNYYEADRDLWGIMKKRMKSGLERRLDAAQEGMSEIAEEAKKGCGGLSSDEANLLKRYRSRLGEAEAISREVKQILKLL